MLTRTDLSTMFNVAETLLKTHHRLQVHARTGVLNQPVMGFLRDDVDSKVDYTISHFGENCRLLASDDWMTGPAIQFARAHSPQPVQIVFGPSGESHTKIEASAVEMTNATLRLVYHMICANVSLKASQPIESGAIVMPDSLVETHLQLVNEMLGGIPFELDKLLAILRQEQARTLLAFDRQELDRPSE